jgi:hypothetical protein
MTSISPNRAELARFWRSITKQANGCWMWTGTGTNDGYGYWYPSPGKPRIMTHLYSYLLHGKTLEAGMDVGHACHDHAVAAGTCDGGETCPHRRCCNPAHLEAQTRSQNTLAQRHHARNRTECPKGHPYDDENTYTDPAGKRRCRRCKRGEGPSSRE